MTRVAYVFVSLALTACAAAPVRAPVASAPVVAPDVRGEPLTLLPGQPLAWLRVDAAAVRASEHWGSVQSLLAHNASAQMRALERELGFELLAVSEVFAVALYAPTTPRVPGVERRGWPVFYARGAFDAEALLTAARVRAGVGDPLVEHMDHGMRVYATSLRAYVFPARDVVIMFEPELTRRVMRVLSGEDRETPLQDARFESLWTQAGGNDAAAIRFAADVAQLRDTGQTSSAREDPSRTIDQVVGRAAIASEVHARIVAQATTEAAARELVTTVDDARQQALRRFEVRLLALSRLLNQGLTAVDEGRIVRIELNAQSGEASRILRAAQLTQFGSQ